MVIYDGSNLSSNSVQGSINRTHQELNNTLFEELMRYVILKYNDGNFGEPYTYKTGIMSGNPYSNQNYYFSWITQSDYELIIVRVRKGYDVPKISESNIPDGWTSLSGNPYPVSTFLSRISDTSIYINEELKKSLIFVKTPTDNWIYALSSALFRVMPWLFPKELDEEDELLFRSISSRDFDKVKEVFDNFVEKYDFEDIIRQKIKGWENNSIARQIEDLRSSYNNIMNEIRDYNVRLEERYTNLDRINNSLKGLNLIPTEEATQVYDYFKKNPSLKIISVSTNNIEFSINETIEYYDEEEFKRIFSNRYSVLGTGNLSDRLRKIFWALFAENKGKVKVDSVFRLTNLSGLTPLRGRRAGNTINTMPHPHLFYHACLGGNESYIRKYLQSGDWDMALTQAISATKNINFGDTTVLREFVNDFGTRMNDNRHKVIRVENTDMTLQEFYQYITQEEENNEEDN